MLAHKTGSIPSASSWCGAATDAGVRSTKAGNERLCRGAEDNTLRKQRGQRTADTKSFIKDLSRLATGGGQNSVRVRKSTISERELHAPTARPDDGYTYHTCRERPRYTHKAALSHQQPFSAPLHAFCSALGVPRRRPRPPAQSSRCSASFSSSSACQAVGTAQLTAPVDLQRVAVVRARLELDLHGPRRPPH